MDVLNILEKLYSLRIKEDISEMANLTDEDTGLTNIVIYVSDKSNSRHGPRIKVSGFYSKIDKTNLFSVTIEDNPKVIGNVGNIRSRDVESIKSFVVRNKDILLKYWNLDISIGTLIKGFVK